MKILLDPGHGGGRRHNRGFRQVENLPYCNEGDCNYIYALNYLKPALEKYGFQVGITRNNINSDPSLQTRGAMGKGYDILISCHTNAANGNARGVEIWDSVNPKESIKKLTDLICANLARDLNIPNRGTKYRKNARGQNYYGILRHGQAKHNFIIEHVFHDNLQDATIYRKNLDKTANSVAKSIAEYYGLEKSSTSGKSSNPEKDFIQTIVNSLKGQKLRILPSVTIAQAILESNWGKSDLAINGNNLFGIKSSPDWKGEIYSKKTNEQKPTGEVYVITANFRKYKNIIESIKDHDKFFVSTPWRTKNYERVLNAKNYKEQAEALRACGYATDINYGNKLINLIERLGLQIYDKELNKTMEKDNSIPSNWAKEDWEWGIKNKITDGTNPKGLCTREQVIAMIRRANENNN